MRAFFILIPLLFSSCGRGFTYRNAPYRGFGNAASFAGADDLLQGFAGTTVSTFTVEAWVMPTAVTATADRAVGVSFSGGTLIGIAMAGPALGARGLYATSCAGAAVLDGTTVMTVGTRYHVAVVQDSGGSAVFVNGVRENYVGTVLPSACPWTTIRIGSGGGGNYFRGLVDDVRVSNVPRALSTDTTFPKPSDSYVADSGTLFLSGLDSSFGWSVIGVPLFVPSPFP